MAGAHAAPMGAWLGHLCRCGRFRSRSRRGRWVIRVAAALAGPACAALPLSAAHAQPSCQIEDAQRLFGQQPRPTAEIGRLLADCQAGGSSDYRVDMFLGVMARDAGDRRQAIAHLRKAHELAPQEPNPALELAFTLEANQAREARSVYEQVLAREPTSRPALLGLARVARGQNRLADAQDIYTRLLALDPQDPEALNGLAWVALARRDRRQARAGFERVLAIRPNDDEAKVGQSKAPAVYRYLLETTAAEVSTSQGTSWGTQIRGTAGLTPFDTLELGWRHFSNELPVVSSQGVTTLPSNDFSAGYYRLKPLSYAVALVYDYRERAGRPTEHWIDGDLTLNLTDRLQWFGAYRQAFGAPEYDGRLFRTGLGVTLTPTWQVAASVYDSQQASFHHYRDLWSGVVDVTYAGSRGKLFVVGVGATPDVNDTEVHGRAILPVTDRMALQLVAGHNSSNAATTLAGGLLFTW